jgi:hypothetical protein
MLQEYSRQAGNLDLQLGLGSQADTLGQEQMQGSQVSDNNAEMQRIVLEATTEVIKDIGWYLWKDDMRVYQDRRMLTGNTPHDIEITPDMRDGDVLDYHFSVNPYSMTSKTPQQRAQALVGTMERLAPFLQPGMPIDPEKLLRIFAKYLDMPELMEVYAVQPNPEQDTGPQMRQSPVTTRNYVRQSKPGASREGNAQTAMNRAAGQRVAPAMAAAEQRRA